MIKKLVSIGLALFAVYAAYAQEPKYTKKSFVTEVDTSFYNVVLPDKDGFQRTYIIAHPRIWDIDDDQTTWIIRGTKAFIIIEGNIRDNKRDGVFSFYILDSLEPSKRYKLWDQLFKNDQLDGKWNTYSLNGVLCSFQTYEKDSLKGIARDFWIDGKTILTEHEYFGSRNEYIRREYYPNRTVKSETPIQNDKLNGIGKKFYENGKLLETVSFKDGKFDGPWKYYYDNGQLWMEKIYKEGKHWNIVCNFSKDGENRNAGTLKEGFGNVVYYNEDGSVREIIEYKNGTEAK